MHHVDKLALTCRYQAPELLSTEYGSPYVYDQKIDVYAYGITLFELAAAKTAYGTRAATNPDELRNAVLNRERPSLDGHVFTEYGGDLCTLLNLCWRNTRIARPSFHVILVRKTDSPSVTRSLLPGCHKEILQLVQDQDISSREENLAPMPCSTFAGLEAPLNGGAA
jgi:hypothetical protein